MTPRATREEVEERLAIALEKHLPGLGPLQRFERLTGGASQETYRLVVGEEGRERKLALRRMAGGVWVEDEPARVGLKVEAELMRLAREAGVPEPEVLAVLEKEDGLGAGFLMEWLEGETLGARIVRAEALAEVRPRLARECGEILGRIHAIDLDTTGLRDRLDTVSPRDFVEQTWAAYKVLATPQPMIDYTARWLIENLPENPRLGLVHNDFRNGNIMVDPTGVVAVLDWELAHIGDPIRDLGWICTNSWRFGQRELAVGGFGALEDLLDGYASTSGDRVDPQHVRFWEVFGSFWWAVGCLGMAHHFRTGPDGSVERAAIGRRSSECQVDCVNLLIPGPAELIAPSEDEGNLDMPRADELVSGVRDLLRNEIMEATKGRLSFLSRVAGNALDIVVRELALGEEHRRRERAGLSALLGREADLASLRWQLVEALRDGSMPLDRPGLEAHLRNTVVNQAGIDQPRYSGYRAAAERTSESAPTS